MVPTLHAGDWVLVEASYYQHHAPKQGEIVLVEHPHRQGYVMVKRISSVVKEQLTIVGDNPEQSTDSRHFGPVHRRQLQGKVWSRL